jgi:tRNA(fMet)-specific endonuclease VapC
VASLYVSAITEGELFFGLAKRPDARRLHAIVGEFLKRVEVLPWDSTVTRQYGIVRADMERNGRALAPPDLLIAAHALAVGAILVSSDKAFGLVPNLSFEDWSF